MLPQVDALVRVVPHARVRLVEGADHLSVFGHTAELGMLIREAVGLAPAAGRR
jgi:hypothetical protein